MENTNFLKYYVNDLVDCIESVLRKEIWRKTLVSLQKIKLWIISNTRVFHKIWDLKQSVIIITVSLLGEFEGNLNLRCMDTRTRFKKKIIFKFFFINGNQKFSIFATSSCFKTCLKQLVMLYSLSLLSVLFLLTCWRYQQVVIIKY